MDPVEYVLKPGVSQALTTVLAQLDIARALIAAVLEAEGLSHDYTLVGEYKLVPGSPGEGMKEPS